MNTKQTEALKLALEALEDALTFAGAWPNGVRAVTAIREALAEQPAQQQEPVAFLVEGLHEGVVIAHQIYFTVDEAKRTAAVFVQHYPTVNTKPLYTSPPASKPWVGLTDVEWINIVNKDHAWFGQRPEDVAHEVSKLVEAKLREKNA